MKYVLISSIGALTLGLGVFLLAPSTATDKHTPTAQASTITAASVPDDKVVTYPTELVELFTSQGCSSCPPADKFIASLADSPSTVALSFNVTYWDFLGWKDRFGQREFTKRQKQYAKTLGIGSVYTPQIVLNGESHSNRYTRDQVKRAKLPNNRPKIGVAFNNRSLQAQAAAGVDMGDFDLTLIAYQPGLQSTPVARGENRSRTLENYNVVKEVYELNADTDYSVNMPQENDGMAYLLLTSDPKTAKVLSLTQVRPK